MEGKLAKIFFVELLDHISSSLFEYFYLYIMAIFLPFIDEYFAVVISFSSI